jgi:Carbon-nitrogen hydrolase
VAAQQSHALETSKRTIQRAVGRQETSIGDITQAFGDFVAVKLVRAVPLQIGRGETNRDLKGDQTSRLSSHAHEYKQIYVYSSRCDQCYPETVRWAVRRGAQLVFHPHAHVAEPGSYRPVTFADPANTFHEKAMLCRAAENTCYFASVNCASEGSGTTSAVVRPDGTLQCYQPYGQDGLLVADLDLSTATGWLASRCRISPM